jgi:hypothetical protein
MGADEERKRVIGIIAGILPAHHMPVADDLFGGRREARQVYNFRYGVWALTLHCQTRCTSAMALAIPGTAVTFWQNAQTL